MKKYQKLYSALNVIEDATISIENREKERIPSLWILIECPKRNTKMRICKQVNKYFVTISKIDCRDCIEYRDYLKQYKVETQKAVISLIFKYFSDTKPKESVMKTVSFGDGCSIRVPKKPIDCSNIGYFDELEYDCWELIKTYCGYLGIEIVSGDISFDIAKGIQDHIIEQFQKAGVQLIFNQDKE